MKKIISLLILAALLLSLLAACGNTNAVITAEQAQKIALEDAGLTKKDVSDVHTHVGTYDNAPCYSVHIIVDGEETDPEYEYFIDPRTGDILDSVTIG